MNTGSLLVLAEVMDKMTPLEQVWIHSVLLGLVGFLIARIDRRFILSLVALWFSVTWLGDFGFYDDPVTHAALSEDPRAVWIARASLVVVITGIASGHAWRLRRHTSNKLGTQPIGLMSHRK
ncbi:MAG TPA: hypothetical protein PKA27_03355 [Fimbriimonadaceae bacterium]|nr:hypothetical protein [Fimbriimonadaceae bacterium]